SLLVAIGAAARPRFVSTIMRAAGGLGVLAGIGAFAALVHGVPPIKDTSLSVPSLLPFVGTILIPWGIATAWSARRPRLALVGAGARSGRWIGRGGSGRCGPSGGRGRARQPAKSIPADTPVICWDTYRTSLPFYLKRTVTVLSDSGGALTSNYVISQRARLQG